MKNKRPKNLYLELRNKLVNKTHITDPELKFLDPNIERRLMSQLDLGIWTKFYVNIWWNLGDKLQYDLNNK